MSTRTILVPTDFSPASTAALPHAEALARQNDGRLVIVFRNAAPNAKDKGGFIAWVGTYDDIKQGKPGQYRVSLLKTFKDGFYAGIHLLPDGTIVATTYANYRKEDIGCSIVSVRFKLAELDAKLKR